MPSAFAEKARQLERAKVFNSRCFFVCFFLIDVSKTYQLTLNHIMPVIELSLFTAANHPEAQNPKSTGSTVSN